MGYISYFDLLGTRGFCENPKVYFKNINTFNETIKQMSSFLNNCGRVGVFSDCAYAECSNLQYMLDFLVEVRDRLASNGLFFNAVLKAGSLDVEYIPETDTQPSFGIVLNDSKIADLYITQTNFKGIGIFVDKSIAKEINDNTGYKTTDCIYIKRNTDQGKIILNPIAYKDIMFDSSDYSKSIENILYIFYQKFYSAYVKSPKFGLYYISAFCNFLRSCNKNFKWNFTNNNFENPPFVFKVVENMLNLCGESLPELSGVEYLALIMLDIVYSSNELNDEAKRSFTKKIFEIEYVRNKFIHSLNDIPDSIFTYNSELDINNRNLFIDYCQEDLSDVFVEQLFDKI